MIKKIKNIEAEIEAILFAQGEFLEREKIKKFLKLSKKEFEKKINILKNKYKEDNSGLQIVEKGDRIQLVTKSELSDTVIKFLGKAVNEELSKTTLEVLAIIAYRGPITRANIEYIRGVNSSFPLRTLLLKGVIERQENPLDNRSYLYQVSFDFLKSLGLQKIEDLQNYEELSKELSSEIDNVDEIDKIEEKRKAKGENEIKA